jgi:regulation of enolase protein 1 (concanavalin A-like superfamily)
MRITIFGILLLANAFGATALAEPVLFQDDFQGKLGEGWSWVREDPAGWRATEKGLEIRVAPGNMWGGANDARNVLVRPLPDTKDGALSIALTVTNDPSNQYEQINLVWYYDDAHMVKIGLERVHGQNSLVMGREEADKTTTLAIIPVTSTTLDVRLTLRGSTLHGEFREAPAQEWRPAGKCEAPVKGTAKASIQAYQGAPETEHWAKVTGFRVEVGE